MTLPFADRVPMSAQAPPRAEAVIDLTAIRDNVTRLRAHAGGRELIAVVKADGYGHGMHESARAARAGGADWLGVALLDEALRLRAGGDRQPILSWLAVPGERYVDGIDADIEMSAYSSHQLLQIAEAARLVGRPAHVQLKVDSGLGRGGAYRTEWQQLVDLATDLQAQGRVRVTGIWSHLACADEPDHPSVAAQTAEFEAGLGYAVDAGLELVHVHLANSAAVLGLPQTWFSAVRPGIAVYGVSPFASGRSPVELTPAMTLQASLAMVKRVPAGHGVSYGHTYVTAGATTLGLVPLGYGDGVPRHASGTGPVDIGGRRFTVAGRVCMDQFVVDLADAEAHEGDRVVLFGTGAHGEPTATDWAAAADTIGYEIVTRIGSRVPRRYVGDVR